MKVTKVDESTRYINAKRAIYGDPSGKIKTFAIISPENPIAWVKADIEQDKVAEYEKDRSAFNKQSRNRLKAELTDKQKEVKRKAGDTALRMGGFNYVPIAGSYGTRERSFLIFNLPLADAKIIARDYGQESFFYGKVLSDHSEISYYETTNGITYKLIETSTTVTDEADAEDFYSKFGFKYKIHLKKFEDDDKVESVLDESQFSLSMDEKLPFMSRALARRRCYGKDGVK